MAGLDRVPSPPTIATMDMTATIGGTVGRTVAGGFGGVTPILRHLVGRRVTVLQTLR
jgi:hypothetical protein